MTATAAPTAKAGTLAIDGGTPVRTRKFPAWPNVTPEDEAALLAILYTIDRVELLRNTEVIRSAAPGTDVWDGEWTDDTPLETCALQPRFAGDRPFVFYYVRLVQANRQRAWASPIWLTGTG